jgi:hypothetical protein
VDFTEIRADDAPCSGRPNAGARIANVFLAQTHFAQPTTADITMNDGGQPLDRQGVRPAFRLVSHRSALLKVGVVGQGASPEVKVIARRRGAALGALCLKGPDVLPAALGAEQRLDDSFLVNLPADWIRTGLELEIRAGAATRMVPAAELRIAGGVRHMVVDMPIAFVRGARVMPLAKFTARYASNLPVQSLVWSRFPVLVETDPLVLPPSGELPARVQLVQQRNFDEIGEALSIGQLIQEANGQYRQTSYYGNTGPGYPGGLGLVGAGAASGAPSRAIFRHELGHTYGLGHLEPMYDERRYPYLRTHDGKGGGVGPFWAYMQIERLVFSPWDERDPTLTKRDAMAGGDGPDNFYGHFTVQFITDYFQNKSFWDDERRAYVVYDPASGEFAPERVQDDNWYNRPLERDTPLYTVWGTASESVAEASTVQPLLHYRGNLLRVMDPTNDEHLAWLRTHPGAICGSGCDFIVRVTFEGGRARTFLVDRRTRSFQRWAINVRDEGRVTKVQLYRRVLRNDGNTAAREHVTRTTGATILEGATLLVERAFN